MVMLTSIIDGLKGHLLPTVRKLFPCLVLSAILTTIYVAWSTAGQTVNPETGRLDLCVTVEEEDQAPSNQGCLPVRVNNGSLTNNTSYYSLDINAGAGSGGWTDDGTEVRLSTSTDEVEIGNAATLSSKLGIDGDADEIQLLVQGNATQTSLLSVWENSGGTDQITFDNVGNVEASGIIVGDRFVTLAEDIAFSSVTSDWEVSDDVNITDSNPHIQLVDIDGDDFEWYGDVSNVYLTNVTDNYEIFKADDANDIITLRTSDLFLFQFSDNGTEQTLSGYSGDFNINSPLNGSVVLNLFRTDGAGVSAIEIMDMSPSQRTLGNVIRIQNNSQSKSLLLGNAYGEWTFGLGTSITANHILSFNAPDNVAVAGRPMKVGIAGNLTHINTGETMDKMIGIMGRVQINTATGLSVNFPIGLYGSIGANTNATGFSSKYGGAVVGRVGGDVNFTTAEITGIDTIVSRSNVPRGDWAHLSAFRSDYISHNDTGTIPSNRPAIGSSFRAVIQGFPASVTAASPLGEQWGIYGENPSVTESASNYPLTIGFMRIVYPRHTGGTGVRAMQIFFEPWANTGTIRGGNIEGDIYFDDGTNFQSGLWERTDGGWLKLLNEATNATITGTWTFNNQLTIDNNNNLRFNPSGNTFGWSPTTNDFELSNDLNITDVEPHLSFLDSTTGERDFHFYADSNMFYLTDFTNSVELFRFSPTNNLIISNSDVFLTTANTDLIIGSNAKINTVGSPSLEILSEGNDRGIIGLTAATDTNSYPFIDFIISGGTLNSRTIITDGSAMGLIAFSGYDGAGTNVDSAYILSEVDGTPGANDMPGRLIFSTTPDGDSSPDERIRIRNSGQVTIGSSTLNLAFLGVDGIRDEIQMLVQGFSTQTSFLQTWENSGGTDQATLSNTGNFTASGTMTVVGNVQLQNFDCSGQTNGGALTTTSSGVLQCSADDGGTGSPGGSDTQLQYNNASSFGGTAGVTWTSGTSNLAMASGIIVDMSSVAGNFTTDGLRIPQSTEVGGSTAEGQVKWDTDDDELTVGTGSIGLRIGTFIASGAEINAGVSTFDVPIYGTDNADINSFPIIPIAITCRNLYANVSAAPGAGNSWIVTVSDDGTDSGNLTCTISGTATSCTNLAGTTSSMAAGSVVEFLYTETGTATSADDGFASMACYPDGN